MMLLLSKVVSYWRWDLVGARIRFVVLYRVTCAHLSGVFEGQLTRVSLSKVTKP